MPLKPFAQELLDLLNQAIETPVTAKSMFGGVSFYTNEAIFAAEMHGELYFKVDDQTKPEFQSAGGKPFIYTGHGKATEMPYWTGPKGFRDSPESLQPYITLALQASQRAKAKKNKKK